MKRECVVIARSGKDAVDFCRNRGISNAALIYDMPTLAHQETVTGFRVYLVGRWEQAKIDAQTLGQLICDLEQKGAVFEDVAG